MKARAWVPPSAARAIGGKARTKTGQGKTTAEASAVGTWRHLAHQSFWFQPVFVRAFPPITRPRQSRAPKPALADSDTHSFMELHGPSW